jgi:DnaJ-class molecular chaperone
LSDPERRARFDRGEIDGSGAETPPPRPRYRPSSQGRAGPSRGFGDEDWEAMFAEAAQAHANRPAAGEDARYTLTVAFLDAANGATQRISLPEGGDLNVNIPAGLQDGHVLRLRGKGYPGHAGGPPGDALVEISIAPHRFFHREGDDILLDLPVTLQEAVLGASVEVPTISGTVRLKIPPHSANGAKLRLAKRGIKGGSQTVTLRVVLPTQPEPALVAFLETWKPDHPQNVRAELEQGG